MREDDAGVLMVGCQGVADKGHIHKTDLMGSSWTWFKAFTNISGLAIDQYRHRLSIDFNLPTCAL